MIKKILQSFSLAVQNIRSRILHTFLSVLGIVIGVAALVCILSLIDGMEKYANEQISNTTSLNSIVIQSETHKQVNKVWLKKDNYSYLSYEDFLSLQQHISSPIQGSIISKSSKEVYAPGKPESIGAHVFWVAGTKGKEAKLISGHNFTPKDLSGKRKAAIINRTLAIEVTGDSSYHKALGNKLVINSDTLFITGVLDENMATVSQAFLPITLLSESELKENPPLIEVEAEKVDHVAPLKAEIENWLTIHNKTDDLKIVTNEFRLKQAAEGFLLFRIIMGMIVGISVIVGGIGVMNVLLISVTERTVEIGIRKAVGAKRKDIMLQFLSESITIAAFGSFLGLLMGMASTFIFVPLIKSYSNIPFHAAYTLNTLIIISVVAILIGIIFGTYPAMKASRLDPVEAIRKE